MKRAICLQPLSRQHHNGLLAVLLLRKGINKDAPVMTMSKFIDDFFEQELYEHFMLEEKYLLPVFNRYEGLKIYAATIIKEHALLKALKKQVNEFPAVENIQAFADQLEQHIRFEERQVFPEAEKCLSPAEMETVGAVLQHHDDKNCMNYPEKFWE